MKKIFIFLVCALVAAASAIAEVKTVYVNPLENEAKADAVIAKRLYKKALLGLTKAKTIAASSGAGKIVPGSSDASKYDYIMTIVLEETPITEAGTLGNLLGVVSSQKRDPDWEGALKTKIIIQRAMLGDEVFKTTLLPKATNKDKSVALFNATNNFDYDMTDMTDDAFSITGEVTQPEQTDKKNIVKTVRVDLGSKDGTRKNQAFELFKVTGDQREPIGVAKCEQVLNEFESILSINGKKEDNKIISQLIQNVDGTYTIEATSRSRSGFLHSNFQGLDKMFTNEGRPHYLDPFYRTTKPRVGFLPIAVNDNKFAQHTEAFQNAVVSGMANVPTINLVTTLFPNVESARNSVDGLIEITIDKLFTSTEKDKEGKTTYKSEILYTLAGYDVVNDRWIDMKSMHGLGSSTESQAKANLDALGLMDNRVQKFSEDLFPVAASIIVQEEVNEKKKSVKKVRIDQGTDMGLKKGMTFDIFEQRAEGGADSRFLLGEGKVEKDGLTANEAILKVKGKNNGDEKLFELLQNSDENTNIVLISKASYDFLDKGLNFLNRNN